MTPILVDAAVVSTPQPTITEFVPESVFYFEAETELKTFVAQRRRWNNGAVKRKRGGERSR